MRQHVAVAALLSFSLFIGCGDRSEQTAENIDQTQAPAADPQSGTDAQIASPAVPEAPAPASPANLRPAESRQNRQPAARNETGGGPAAAERRTGAAPS